MSNFASLGVTTSVSKISESVEVMGVRSTTRFTQIEATLPKASAVQASFGKEGFVSSVKKLFTKELQTGEKQFDDVVFIATATPEATAKLLSSSSVRATILRAVREGGSVSVVGDVVTVKMQGIADDDADVVAIVAAVLAA